MVTCPSATIQDLPLTKSRYLGNFAAAEMLYQAASQWKRLGAINVTAISQPFFKDVYPSAKIGTIAASSPEFKKIIDAVVSYADSYMEIAVSRTRCIAKA